jgi:anti-sigma B factor antagonist
MSCKVSVRQAGYVSIVDLEGAVSLGESASQMRETLQNLAESGARNILVSLRDVTYVDSSGLGELVRAYTSLTTAGGRIKLLHPDTIVKQVLRVTKLDTVFATYEDEATAAESFDRVRQGRLEKNGAVEEEIEAA